MPKNTEQIFVWRGTFDSKNSSYDSDAVIPYDNKIDHCIWCSTKLHKEEKRKHVGNEHWMEWYDLSALCQFCGWKFSLHHNDINSKYFREKSGSYAVLNMFDLGNEELYLSEIGAHLKNNYADIYNLPSRRFEELVEDVFKCNGYKTKLTKASRDGGADILLLGNEDDVHAIVEVKRYAKDRSVSISVVDRLLGASIRWNVRKAYLVTTSKFSYVVTSEHKKLVESGSEFELEMWDAGRVLTELGCYNEKLPPLNEMNAKRKIFL